MKLLKTFSRFFFLLLLVISIGVFAQAPLEFELVGAEQGLSQGMVFDVIQDKEGFIWAGTKDGLNRYDGYSFKVFTNDPSNNLSLSSNSINDLFEDSKGRIWVGTENDGLNVYDKKSGNFLRIIHVPTKKTGLSNNIIKSIEELPDGTMIISTDDGKINLITLGDNFLEQNVIPLITQISLPNNAKVYGIGNDKDKNTWIGGRDGTLYNFNYITKTFTIAPGMQLLNNGYFTKNNDILINRNLYLYDGQNMTPLFDTKKYPEGNIILKPNQKLWDKFHRDPSLYDVTFWNKDKKINWSVKLPLDKRLIYPFMFDKSGIIWCGTVGYGLKKYNIGQDKFNTQIPGQSVYYIFIINKDEIILGDAAYGMWGVHNNIVTKNALSYIPQITQPDNLIVSKKGDYWIKCDEKGYFKYTPSSKKLTPFLKMDDDNGVGPKQPIFEDSKNRIWFPGLGGKFNLLNTNTEQISIININTNASKPMTSEAFITALYEDKKGVIWVGTMDGFAKINIEDNNAFQIKWYYYLNDGKSLNYNHVTSFLEDPVNPNVLWIGTKGGGINRLDETTDKFQYITVKEGLPDNIIYGILADEENNIWGSTNKGLFCMISQKKENGKHFVFRNYTKADGLQDNEFNTGSYAKLPNGNLMFGGVNGLNSFNPKEVLSQNFTPNVFITNILVNNKPVLQNDKSGVLKNTIEYAETISLTHLQDILTLEFASLDFTKSAQNKYRYMLEGADKEWVDAGTNRNATYLNLSPGKYTFKVQGSNSQGIWSEQIAQIKVIVLPPWWRTWLAYSIYILGLGTAVRAYFKFKVNKAKLKNQLIFEQKEAKRIKELDAVKSHLYTNMTHEFRTPLTVILGMVQQIKKDPAQHFDNGLDMIERNGGNLLKLVNGMLDLSKLEAGKMDLQLIEGDIVNFLRYIIESFKSLAEGQDKKLHYLSTVDVIQTKYDAEKIRQIISNLLSNSLKFTPAKGDIYISISLETTTKNNLCIVVKDTGVGIPESQLPQIFDRFFQADTSHTRKAEGTGIGLALTKELVQLMNGTITVKSPPTGAKNGTAFTIVLPLEILEDRVFLANPARKFEQLSNEPIIKAAADNKVANTKITNETPLILLVEDNADVVAYTATCLHDYRLAVGSNGQEGFDIACDLVPDIIITDVMMPVLDGFEMTKKVRTDERTSHIPIIMLTAKADLESKLEGIDYGADAYLEKPFYKEELLLRVKKLLESRKHLQHYYSKQLGIVDLVAEPMQSTIIPSTNEAIEHEFIKKIRAMIIDNFTNPDFSVEKLCKMVFMSHSQLHRKLDALICYSPNKFIRLVRLNKAKELLTNSDLSIANIALDCGYNDAGYFARVFKQETGTTPQEWRSRIC